MGGRTTGLFALMLVGCASLAGLESVNENSSSPTAEPGAGTTPMNGAGEAGVSPEPAEEAATTFTCGTSECVAGQDSCCVHGANFACVDSKVGCSAPAVDGGDGGVPSGPPINCTTYNNCGENECCWDSVNGAVCRKECSPGQHSLCRLGVDGCGSSSDCKTLPGSPINTIGECVYTGESSSGGRFGGGHGH